MENNLYLDEKDLKAYKIKTTIGKVVLYTFLVIVALFILIPFYWMFATALRSDAERSATDVTIFPSDPTPYNFIRIFGEIKDPSGATLGTNHFLLFFWNTLKVGFFTTIFSLATTILAAFAFARLNFKGKDQIFGLMLATMMIPGEIYVITNYMTIADFGNTTLLSWAGLDTHGALILPFIVGVFDIFFLRQSFMQIPNELYLAAKVDGTGDFKYLFKVMIPLAKSTIITLLILSMMGTWNAYVWPNLVITSEELRLVSDGLLHSFAGEGIELQNLQMAASAIVTLPLLIVFIFLKKYIMRGVSRSGIKG